MNSQQGEEINSALGETTRLIYLPSHRLKRRHIESKHKGIVTLYTDNGLTNDVTGK